MKYVLERHISSRTDNWGISNGHLSGKLWSLSSLALTTGMASLIGMLVNSEETSYETSFCPGGTSSSAILLTKSSLLTM